MYAQYVNDPKACDSAGRVLHQVLGVSLKERDAMHTQYLINLVHTEENYCIASQKFAELCYHTGSIAMLSSKTNNDTCLKYLKSKTMLTNMIDEVVSKIPSSLEIDEGKLTDVLLLLTHTTRTTLVQALMQIKNCIGLGASEEELFQLAAEVLKRSVGYTSTEYDDGVVISGVYVYPLEITIKLKYATKVYITPEPLTYGDHYKPFTTKNKAKPSDEDEYYLYCSSDQLHTVDQTITSLPFHIPSHDKEGIPLTVIQQQIIAAQVAQLRAFVQYYTEGYLTTHRDGTGRMHDAASNKLYRYALKSDKTCHISQEERLVLELLLT